MLKAHIVFLAPFIGNISRVILGEFSPKRVCVILLRSYAYFFYFVYNRSNELHAPRFAGVSAMTTVDRAVVSTAAIAPDHKKTTV